MCYVYFDMLWTESTFQVQVGYTYNNVNETITPEPPAPFNRLRFDKAPGNTLTNDPGIFCYTLSITQSPSNKVYREWVAQQPTQETIANLYSESSQNWQNAECPCSISQLVQDSRYEPENRTQWSNIRCHYNRGVLERQCSVPLEEVTTFCVRRKESFVTDVANLTVSTRCCFDAQSNALIKTVTSGNEPGTQNHFTFFNGQFQSNKTLRDKVILRDTEAFQATCVKETALCQLYLDRIRIPQCDYYKPPSIASGFGDPHLRTLDGHPYTFNGLGDYMLLQTDTLKVHARTCQFHMNGVSTPATIFCGYAVQDAKASTMIEVYHRRGESFVLN